MLVSGYGLNGKENVVIVELKQWEMEAIVLEKNRARNRARILAGYCWNWPKATRNNTNFHDIEIGDYSISWNLNGGDAVRIMKELYNIDMEADGQFSKLVSDIPNPDIAISMGCNVGCPFIGRPFDDNWGLEDPTGKSDEEFKIVIEKIRKDILKLKNGLDKR